MKNKSVIVINGRHYDAHTGKPLHGHNTHAPAAKYSHRPDRHVSSKPHAGRTSVNYRPTRHIRAHKAEPAHTLMRKGVKKPGPSAKRRIKVQGNLGTGGGREQSRIISHREPESYARHSRNHAVKATHSRLISHFSPELFSVDDHTSLAMYGSKAGRPTAPRRPAGHIPPKKHTTDELLDYAVQHANTPHRHAVKRRHGITRHRSHAKQHA